MSHYLTGCFHTIYTDGTPASRSSNIRSRCPPPSRTQSRRRRNRYMTPVSSTIQIQPSWVTWVTATRASGHCGQNDDFPIVFYVVESFLSRRCHIIVSQLMEQHVVNILNHSSSESPSTRRRRLWGWEVRRPRDEAGSYSPSQSCNM